MKYALKEWNTTIEALGKGLVIAIWRKGGLGEKGGKGENFKVEQNKFILYPTFTHQSPDKIKRDFWYLSNGSSGPNVDNQVKIKYFAEVEETLQIDTLDQLLNISNELANTEEYLISSWNLNPHNEGKLLLLRVFSLNNPILITDSPKYAGCKSWIELKIDIPKAGSKTVLSFRNLQAKVRLIKALLKQAPVVALETSHAAPLL